MRCTHYGCTIEQSGGRTHAAPLLQSLHWLPVQQHITYKTAVLTHVLLTTSTPSYLSDMLYTAAPARHLRSAAASLLVPRTRTDIAGRAFSAAAPSVWNSLPADIRLCDTTATFKRHQKTNFLDRFSLAPLSTSVSSDFIGAIQIVLLLLLCYCNFHEYTRNVS